MRRLFVLLALLLPLRLLGQALPVFVTTPPTINCMPKFPLAGAKASCSTVFDSGALVSTTLPFQGLSLATGGVGATHTVTAAHYVGPAGANVVSSAGGAFTNQPAGDTVTLVSDNAADTGVWVWVTGELAGADQQVQLQLNGVVPVTTGVTYDRVLALNVSTGTALGTITASETSGGLPITTIVPPAVSAGMDTVSLTGNARTVRVVASGATTKVVGIAGYDHLGNVIREPITLTGTTAVTTVTRWTTVLNLYIGDLEVGRTITVTAPGGVDFKNGSVSVTMDDAGIVTAPGGFVGNVTGTASGNPTNGAGADVISKSDGTNLVASSFSNASAGLLSGPAGQAIEFRAVAPAAGANAQAGVGVTITGSPAVDGSSGHAAVNGGDVTLSGGPPVNGGAYGAIYVTNTYGFSVAGAGATSERFGLGATSAGNASVAVGLLAAASGASSVAVGKQAVSAGIASVAVGATASAPNDGGIAIGSSALASATSAIGIGNDVSATHAGAIVFGESAVSTAANQLTFGSTSVPIRSVMVVGLTSIQGGTAKTLTESSATGYVDITFASNTVVGGKVRYTIQASDATDYQALTGEVFFTAVNKAGTTTCTVGLVGTEILAESAGGSTLTQATTCTTAAGKITLLSNAVSSLTQTTLKIVYTVEVNHLTGVTVAGL